MAELATNPGLTLAKLLEVSHLLEEAECKEKGLPFWGWEIQKTPVGNIITPIYKKEDKPNG